MSCTLTHIHGGWSADSKERGWVCVVYRCTVYIEHMDLGIFCFCLVWRTGYILCLRILPSDYYIIYLLGGYLVGTYCRFPPLCWKVSGPCFLRTLRYSAVSLLAPREESVGDVERERQKRSTDGYIPTLPTLKAFSPPRSIPATEKRYSTEHASSVHVGFFFIFFFKAHFLSPFKYFTRYTLAAPQCIINYNWCETISYSLFSLVMMLRKGAGPPLDDGESLLDVRCMAAGEQAAADGSYGSLHNAAYIPPRYVSTHHSHTHSLRRNMKGAHWHSCMLACVCVCVWCVEKLQINYTQVALKWCGYAVALKKNVFHVC